jgi:predicted nucleic acid-binding protein
MAIESLRAMPAGSHIFIDANIFLYTILGHPHFKSPCEEFLIKLENGEYEGTTSTLILNEVVHKLMLAEVVKNNRLSSEHEALKMIRKDPGIISKLHSTWSNYAYIRRYPITIVEVDERAMDLSVQFSKSYWLLISDAVHIAIMKSRGIVDLASNDSDFERVAGINIWKP